MTSSCLLVADAPAGKKNKKKNPEPVVVVVPKPVPEPTVPVFPKPPPLMEAAVPDGLANVSAQGCAACHIDSHSSWATSTHATGWRSDAFRTAVRAAAEPACENCHLPLLVQRPLLYTVQNGVVEKEAHTPNPTFDAGLRAEGVTCITCHLRDGAMLSARPKKERGEATHAVAYAPELSTSKACAPCHQLSWPGANAAFYDTFGEWSASPWAKAGVQCQDCHGGNGADPGFDHATDGGHALSVLMSLPSLEIVRGDAPTTITVTLQNTGAGHAFPTGSPFTGAEVSVELVGPPAPKKTDPTHVQVLTHPLGRALEETPPWNVVADTRLAAGETRTVDAEILLAHETSAGDWVLQANVWKTVRGERGETLLQSFSLPVRVE